MNKLIILIGVSLLLFTSCKKDNATNILNEMLPASVTTLVAGSVTSSAHPSSGTIKVVRDAANKIFLVFENFKTDNGPDLRVRISPENDVNPFQEVGLLKASTGNFSYELNASFNYTTNNRVLIWCQPFSVLYGYAVLK